MFLRKIIFFIFLLVVIGYAIFASRGVVLPPKLEVLSPKNYSTFNTTNIKISGFTDPSTILWINGRISQSDKKGFFEENFTFHPGYNETGISVKNRFGRETKKVLKFVVE